MILKVRTKLDYKNGWLVIGSVRSVSSSEDLITMTYSKLLEVSEVGDYLVFSSPFKESKDVPSFDPNNQEFQCGYMVVTTMTEERINVWFNAIAYLMNDEGKTIDTIYGY